MLNLGIVGTGWIGGSFAEGCAATGQYSVRAVCSRDAARAAAFGKSCGAQLFFEDVGALAACPEVDVVYIASPNSLHHRDCCTALAAGKHVIVEKPGFSNIREAEHAFDLARRHGMLLFEAARHVHEANHSIVKQQVRRMGALRGANLSYLQRSSRCDRMLADEAVNIFSLQFSGGALMDLGVYLVYAAVDWFGMPDSARYFCRKTPTGVDGGGVMVFQYPGFVASLSVSKISDSTLPCEIQADTETLLLDAVHNIGSIRLTDQSHNVHQLARPKKPNWMEEEALAFAQMIQGKGSDWEKRYRRLRDLALNVHTLMTQMREEAGILFPADEKTTEDIWNC